MTGYRRTEPRISEDVFLTRGSEDPDLDGGGGSSATDDKSPPVYLDPFVPMGDPWGR